MPLNLILGQSCHDVSMMDLMGSVSPDAAGALGLAPCAGIEIFVCLFLRNAVSTLHLFLPFVFGRVFL